MDKIDGPYYFFKAIQRPRQLLPEWVPLVAPDLGYTNVVPVDWVAGALEHIAHEPDLDGRAFHLTDPRRQRVEELINALAAAAHAPRFAVSIDKRLTDPLPKWPLELALALPPLRQARELALRELGIPQRCSRTWSWCRASTRARASRALAGIAARAAAGAARLRRAPVGLLGARHGPELRRGAHAASRRSTAST